MSTRNVHIDRLEIRMKGISPEAARASASGLGSEVLEGLGSIANANQSKRDTRIGKVDAGNLKVDGATGPTELRRRMAEQVVRSIQAKIK